MSAKVEAGVYQCKTTGATIYEAQSGAVMCRIAVDLGLTGGICLVQKDGTLSERGFRDAAAILGIEGVWDWAAWNCEPEEWAGHDVEVVVEIVQGEKGEFSSVKYLNPPGGSVRMERADAKSLAAKYGAKTRALFGGVPAKAVADMKPASAIKPPVPRAKKTAPATGESTMEECWAKWCDLHKIEEREPTDEEIEQWESDVWGATNKASGDCSPADWGKMMETMKGKLPF